MAEVNNNSKKANDLVILDEDELNQEVQKTNGFVPEAEESFLYDNALVQALSFEHLTCFNPKISPAQPGMNLMVRSLGSGDYERGFLDLLAQLTKVGEISKSDFLKRFNSMKGCKGTYYVTVIEDTSTHEIIGAATLVVEQKFIRGCAKKGIIEEVVVSDRYRGRQLGKLIVATLIEMGKSLGCYKVSLNCTDQMIKFYCSLGFKQEEGNANFLQIRM
uniref:Glucosamine 6-phosphate N-acetyltransferase n=1 Tax=Tigriopus japonicus TaxID=158387 RepID=A0A1U9XQT0_TIGJA|nr:glucosamine-6-phosphate-N-acetyltransferase [Tigriopus japonicus]